MTTYFVFEDLGFFFSRLFLQRHYPAKISLQIKNNYLVPVLTILLTYFGGATVEHV